MPNLPRFIDTIERDHLLAELSKIGWSETEALSMIDEQNMQAQDAQAGYWEQEAEKREALVSARDEYEAARTQTINRDPLGAGSLEFDPFF